MGRVKESLEMYKIIPPKINSELTKKEILNDLLRMEFQCGMNSGRWEQNEYDRLSMTQNWNAFIEDIAYHYGIGFNSKNIDYEDECELDMFTSKLHENIKNIMINLLNITD